MLLCGIIEDFEKDSEFQGEIAFFFCQGTDNRINNATAVVRGLIFSILRRHQALLSHIRKQNEKEPKGQLEGPNAWYALCRIFKTIITDPRIKDFSCIIDALDECQHEDSLDLLLRLIVDTSKHVKWLLSSRNEEAIERGLESIEAHQRLVLELKGNSERISQAIEIYINRCVQDIKAIRNYANIRMKTINLLKEKANGTFLWVTLVVQQLRNTKRQHIEKVLQRMPKGLEELYDKIMERIKETWEDDEKACLALLATVTAAERPLRLEELHILINSQISDFGVTYDLEDMIDLVKSCGSFVSIRDDTIYFIHQSVKDYMVQNAAAIILPLGIEHQHYKMVQSSISEMNNTLKRDIYNIRAPGRHVNEVMPPDFDPLKPVRYCCAFWVDHLVLCCQQHQYQECLKDNGIIHTFLKEKYLYWLEAMVFLKTLPQAVIAILKLRDLIAIPLNNSEAEVCKQWKESKKDEIKQHMV